MTRWMGTPRVANVLYLGVGLVVLGWLDGAVSSWLAFAAIGSVAGVRRAVRDVRKYDQWWTAWQGMGAASASPPPATPRARKRKVSSPWAGVIVAALSLVLIPVVIAAPGANAALRQALTLLWGAVVLYLFWKLAAKLRRAVLPGAAGTASAGGSKNTAPDVVEWLLPRASSSPSRADAMRHLPDYSARLIAANTVATH